MKINDNQKPYLFRLTCLIFLLITLIANGCATTPQVKPIEKSDYVPSLHFLVDGKTTREEVLLTLGEPSGVFEADRILTYILVDDGKLHVIPRQAALRGQDTRLYYLTPKLFSLVLVFGKDNILEKHSLIGTKDEIK